MGTLDSHSGGLSVTETDTSYLNLATCASLTLGISKSTYMLFVPGYSVQGMAACKHLNKFFQQIFLLNKLF